jgi:cell shape-determining protein MreC
MDVVKKRYLVKVFQNFSKFFKIFHQTRKNSARAAHTPSNLCKKNAPRAQGTKSVESRALKAERWKKSKPVCPPRECLKNAFPSS